MNLFPEKLTEDNGSIKVDGGITLRDYFATAAMQAILTSNGGSAPNRWELVADAYTVADALLDVRKE